MTDLEGMNLIDAYMSGVEGGKILEREKIVAWLQRDGILDWLADEIEAG
jgi:hypothetical protein